MRTAQRQENVGVCVDRVYTHARTIIDGFGHAVILAKSPFYFRALVSLKLLVSFISCVVAFSARKETERRTHRHTDHVQCLHLRQ